MGRAKTMGSEKHYPPESRRDMNSYPNSYTFDFGYRRGRPSDSELIEGLDLDAEYVKIAEKKSTLPSRTRAVIKKLKHNNAIAFIMGIGD